VQVSKYGHRAHVHGELITLPYLYNNYICAQASILVSAVQSKSVLASAAADQLDWVVLLKCRVSAICKASRAGSVKYHNHGHFPRPR